MVQESVVRMSMRDENGLDCSYGIVSKGDRAVVVILRDRECGIFDQRMLLAQEFSWDYLLLKHYPDADLAYTDFLKLIGKMCKKSPDSKYFGIRRQEDNRMVVTAAGQEHMIGPEERPVLEDRCARFREFLWKNHRAFL